MAYENLNSQEACCTIPVVDTGDYKLKGEWKELAGIKKVYVVGDSASGKAIVDCFDIMGYSPQILQGADIIAETLGIRVVMHDMFDGKQPDFIPPKSDEDRKAMREWMDAEGNPANYPEQTYKVADALRAEGFTKIGALGYCWGGKIVTMAGVRADKLDAIASVHPGRVSAEDAKELAVPIALFPSKNEPEKECEAFMEGLNGKPFASKNVYKYYSTVIHGWAGARADFKDEENLKQYKDVYSQVCTFFGNVL